MHTNAEKTMRKKISTEYLDMRIWGVWTKSRCLSCLPVFTIRLMYQILYGAVNHRWTLNPISIHLQVAFSECWLTSILLPLSVSERPSCWSDVGLLQAHSVSVPARVFSQHRPTIDSWYITSYGRVYASGLVMPHLLLLWCIPRLVCSKVVCN